MNNVLILVEALLDCISFEFLLLNGGFFFTEIARIGDAKKIFQVSFVPEEQLLIAIAGIFEIHLLKQWFSTFSK